MTSAAALLCAGAAHAQEAPADPVTQVDDVVVTADGHEILTNAVPRDADAVEAILATR